MSGHKEVWSQLTHPLPLLPWLAAALQFAISSSTIGIAVVLVFQSTRSWCWPRKRQAEHSVEALSGEESNSRRRPDPAR